VGAGLFENDDRSRLGRIAESSSRKAVNFSSAWTTFPLLSRDCEGRKRLELTVIDDATRPHIVEWLRDRSAFHTWFSSLVIGSFVVVTVFGSKPDFSTPSGVVLAVAVALLILSLLSNLVCVWSIPSWKFRVSTGALTSAVAMRRKLALTAWVGVITFVAGLTLAFISNMSP
jgi:hypothetical protein